MASAADLSVEMAGLRFKSPILVASSEYGSNVSMLQQLTDRKIGGIVTKTFTSAPDFRIRVRPYQFPLNKFGKAYAQGGCLYSLAAPHVEATQTVQAHVSRMAAHCRDLSLVLIVSFFEDPHNVDLWIDQARAFEKTGADMLELNFSSPSAASVFSKSFQAAGDIISRVKKNTSIPVGLKLSPTLEPLEAFVTTGLDAGLDFITAHNAPGGIVIDVDNEVPFGAPAVGGYVMGRAFLPYSLGRIVRIRHVANIPVIDTALCTLCGTCETTCIYQVFAVDERQSKVLIDENKCWSCGFCVGICPAGAIELRDRQNKDRLIWNNQGVAESF